MDSHVPNKFASRQVRPEFIQGLELVSNKVYDLPGAVFERRGERDPRLGTAISVGLGETNKVCFYEHIATVRHRPTNVFYVIFKETADALLARQKDEEKYPKWLMDHPVKQTERSIFIHIAKPDAAKLIRSGRVSNIGDWLDAIGDQWIFDSIAYFLLQQHVFTEQMYGTIR
jgi:hypothetical protein